MVILKRLFQVSFDTLCMSLCPILMWIFLGIFVQKELTGIFSIIYPIQSVSNILINIFATGSNIVAYKKGHLKEIDTGILYGAIVGFIIFLLIVLNMDTYLTFLNLSDPIYYPFCVFGVIQLYLQSLMYLIMTKLYYSDQNKKANYYTWTFNIISLVSLVILSILFKNEVIYLTITTMISYMYIIYLFIKNVHINTWKFHLLDSIYYESSSLFSNFLYMLTYFFGYHVSFKYGTNFLGAITFFNLITDIQWDMSYSIGTVAKVDISKNCYKINEHKKNGIYLIILLNLSTVLMGLCLYPFYKPSIFIVLLFLIPNLIDIFIFGTSSLKFSYLQIEDSPFKVMCITQCGTIMRFFCSFLPTPFCTLIGQEISIYFQVIFFYIFFNKKYKIINGNILKRNLVNQKKG